MKYSWLFSILLLLLVLPLNAQNNRSNRPTERPASGTRNNDIPGLGRNALIININASVLDENKVVVWNQSESKMTIPGRHVGINLVGSNVVVVVQFTPFIRRETSVLVAQSQIWIQDTEKGMSYYTSIQTIPIEFGEPVHFFPLGNSGQSNSYIEIIITVTPNNTANPNNEN